MELIRLSELEHDDERCLCNRTVDRSDRILLCLHNLFTMLIFCAVAPLLIALYLLQASIVISPRSMVGSPGMLEGISWQNLISVRWVFDLSAWDPPIDVRVKRQHGGPRSFLGRRWTGWRGPAGWT
ncbi:MAG: hypothetical protein P1P76_07215 [Anaerolineales bacterium]|nr:hypothetical protein [Anaerolineales bacterium]